MITCGGQATTPMVRAVADVVPVPYAEIVASISSKSAGPGTRANIDEFTETTSQALEVVGGADKGKAIIILNPVEPPLMMRNSVFCAIPAEAGEAGMSREIAYLSLGGAPFTSVFWHMLQHVVNHASYHRGQVTTMLRQLGAPAPKSQDMIAFYRERA